METPGTMATQGTMATLLYIPQLANFRPVAMYLHCHVDISLLYKNGSFSLPVSAGTGKNAKPAHGRKASQSGGNSSGQGQSKVGYKWEGREGEEEEEE